MTDPTDGHTSDPTSGDTSSDIGAGTPDLSAATPRDGEATQAIPSAETTAMPQYTYPQGTPEPTTTYASLPSPADPHSASPAAGVTAPHAAGAPSAYATGVELADEPQDGGGGGRKRTGLLIGGLAAALLLGGAGVFAAQQLSGGGSQPADVLPGDAFGYVRLDIDPSAGQKIAAVRFLSKLPQVKDTLSADDPRKKLWELAAKDAGDDCISKLSYDSDIAPWLGDRVGAAIRPGGTADKPNVAVAIQVKDEASAKAALTRIFACEKDSSELRMKDGYAIVTPSGAGDATLAAVAKGSLAQNATFKDDMAALGEQGVLSAWFDLGSGLKEVRNLSALGAPVAPDAKGRLAAALRFDPDYVELAGVVRGATGTTTVTGSGAELANLPDDTAAALHVSGADKALDTAWPQIEKQLQTLGQAEGESDLLGQIEQGLGVKLPDDLKVLLGSSFTLTLPQQDFSSDTPVVGAKIVSSNPKRAEELLDQLDQLAGGGLVTHSADGNKVYVATKPDYAAKLKAGGKLGESDAFKAALGDVSTSNAAMFVDLDKLEKLYLSDVDPDQKAFVEALRAVGLNAKTTGDGEASFTLRVVGN
jgi:hypothetical protein